MLSYKKWLFKKCTNPQFKMAFLCKSSIYLSHLYALYVLLLYYKLLVVIRKLTSIFSKQICKIFIYRDFANRDTSSLIKLKSSKVYISLNLLSKSYNVLSKKYSI